jgi:hypothetical protein
MSGGSFNYLYTQDPYSVEDLEQMADELRSRGMYEAAKETRALIPHRASQELEELWHAVEWHRSCDWSEAQVAKAFVKYDDEFQKRKHIV